MLWMDRNKKDLFDRSVLSGARLEVGNEVGDLAMGYFGDFVEVKFGKHRSDMVTVTHKYLDDGEKVIAEASFVFDGNFCSVDILRVNDDGSFDVVEVKSSTSKNADEETSEEKKVKAVYLDDMAYQYYVLTNCGYKVNTISLMQLNKEYIRHGELDIHELFVVEDYTDIVKSMQSEIPTTLASITAVAEQKSEPLSDDYIGNRCNKPYECGYKAYCWHDMPENNVFDIGCGLWGSKKDKYYHDGLLTMEDALNAGVIKSERQIRQIETKLNGLPPHIDKEGIREFLDTLWYPLYYFDFETWQQAIPLFDGVWPYEQIPTQYSLHIQNEPGGELIHKEFLGKEGEDPRRTIAERICEDIPKDGCMIAYWATFEITRLRELAEMFPDLSDHLLAIVENTWDLIVPFNSGHYYCEAMGGRTSIKVVLPAFFPDDPELDYHALDLVHDGMEAANAFATLHEQTPEDIARIRVALLKYCELDTLAMVKILEKLYAISKYWD
jgi:hypothetical protein